MVDIFFGVLGNDQRRADARYASVCLPVNDILDLRGDR
jgi:hypothetical protein